MALLALSGGVVFQATGGCGTTVAPIIAELLSSVVLNALLGGLVT